MVKEGSKGCISVFKTNLKIDWLLKLDDSKQLRPLLSTNNFAKRRQDIKDTFLPNGAIYISEVKNFLKEKTFFSNCTSAYIMPEKTSIDIDDLSQMKKCEKILSKRIKKLAGVNNQLDEGNNRNYDEIKERI